jgi:hypothetical protein
MTKAIKNVHHVVDRFDGPLDLEKGQKVIRMDQIDTQQTQLISQRPA